MFISTYKVTLKNLIRSKTFWLVLVVLLINTIHESLEGFYADDDSPEMLLSFAEYIPCIVNSCCSHFLMYAMPVFTIITTVLVVNRDYGDHFYEIEKASGLKPSKYLLGRICALITINFIALFVMNLTDIHLYVFTRGGLTDIGIWNYLADSFIRVFRTDLFVAMPCLIFYISTTYFVGTLFKNGIVAAIAGFGYTMFFYVSFLMYRFRIAAEYFDYFSPVPWKLRRYFHFYDTEWFEDMIKTANTSLTDAAICITFLIGVGVLCSVASYLLIRKRST